MMIYNRKDKVYEEESQYGGNMLNILYNHCVGRILLKLIIHPIFSKINGWYNNTRLSKKKIKSFVDEYGICLDDYEERKYKSFNDFFTRKIKKDKRKIDMESFNLVAPADSKLSVYPIYKSNMLQIKGVTYTLEELVGGRIDLKDYEGGKCLVFRLTMDDYHRYIFVDDGKAKRQYGIRGKLHTVSSISKEHRIYRQNSRMVNVLKTNNFGNIICIEVGALLVGKIKNYKVRNFKKGQEKGYFELGGSTIIMLFQNEQINLDEDIAKICELGIEVKVLMGEKIGRKRVC